VPAQRAGPDALPPEQREEQADDADDHQDPADDVDVDRRPGILVDREGQDSADCDQDQADGNAHFTSYARCA